MNNQCTTTIENGKFNNPVWVDLLTGHVYEIPKSDWRKSGGSYTFKQIPLYDSPILLADKSMLKLTN